MTTIARKAAEEIGAMFLIEEQHHHAIAYTIQRAIDASHERPANIDDMIWRLIEYARLVAASGIDEAHIVADDIREAADMLSRWPSAVPLPAPPKGDAT